ncbi:hypothetical protein WA538_001163 [Blastocystis sp. DL]
METKKKHSEEVEELNKQIDAVFASLSQLLQSNPLQDAIDQLLVLEKRARLLLEPTISIRVTDRILDICHDAKDFAKLNASITLLSKRRSQHDDVIAAVVKKAMSYLDTVSDEKEKMELLQTLLDTSDGKMYLEAERARLLRELMRLRESKGDIAGAAAASRELQVEVCNSLSSREKAEFLLEQIRLSQAVNDWVRVPLTIQKVNVRVLKEEGMEDLLEHFLDLCVTQHVHDDDLKALFYDYERRLSLARFEDDDASQREIVTFLTLLAVLMPFDAEQQSLVQSLGVRYSRHWKYLSDFRAFLQCFERAELLRWPLATGDTVQRHALFTESRWGARREEWRQLLRKRVMEHNIRVLGRFVSEARLGRVAELLQVSEEEAEDALAEACVSKMLWVKMDRVRGTVKFVAPKSPESVLTQWSQDVKGVMGGLDRVVYLIEKEKMVKEANQ